jgi:hypothetical protein
VAEAFHGPASGAYDIRRGNESAKVFSWRVFFQHGQKSFCFESGERPVVHREHAFRMLRVPPRQRCEQLLDLAAKLSGASVKSRQ